MTPMQHVRSDPGPAVAESEACFRKQVEEILFAEMEPYHPLARGHPAVVVRDVADRIVVLSHQLIPREQRQCHTKITDTHPSPSW